MTVTAPFAGHALARALASEPEARVDLPYPLLLLLARQAVAAGLWAPPAGVPVEEALDVFAGGLRLNPQGETFISGEADVEEVTIHPDGTRTSRLT
ncbi:hypothetical protein [Methylobacterium radiotolerans]|uniref:Uncharacterized protein n=1 Tax=Methylobacterium radiotolerans (strain ATCC 27329 / DSM 1819 / JCM 2831 / NBRC 15690 / NCIMB 10815 / 0-1) TaxID=426355 RepID=B1LXE1_METRJ|nr:MULTISPECIES: hypothetical protein [Methylobacterium]ACB27262.1 hypothetical protein Mrad2831_5315 [Methylobacterium radiotolerans JCM 2831]GEM98241.1 hypothetical protein MRA01_27810 [Methylobacterium radiotolerans]